MKKHSRKQREIDHVSTTCGEPQNSFDPSKMSGVDPAQIEKLKRIADQLKYALIVIASVPPLLIYPFVQKHFVKGMMIGSLKG